MKLRIDGLERAIPAAAEGAPLLWVLRDTLGLTATRYGCGIGACGACTVLVDGAPVRSCQRTPADIGDAAITTIAGLAPAGALHPVQEAWLAERVAQCGFCQGGQILAAAALLARTSRPTDADVTEAMSGHLCRCGTYPRIRRAIARAADAMAGSSSTVPR